MHAYAMELLEHKLQPGSRVLDVGSGSGYLAVAFAKLVRLFFSQNMSLGSHIAWVYICMMGCANWW